MDWSSRGETEGSVHSIIIRLELIGINIVLDISIHTLQKSFHLLAIILKKEYYKCSYAGLVRSKTTIINSFKFLMMKSYFLGQQTNFTINNI